MDNFRPNPAQNSEKPVRMLYAKGANVTEKASVPTEVPTEYTRQQLEQKFGYRLSEVVKAAKDASVSPFDELKIAMCKKYNIPFTYNKVGGIAPIFQSEMLAALRNLD